MKTYTIVCKHLKSVQLEQFSVFQNKKTYLTIINLFSKTKWFQITSFSCFE